VIQLNASNRADAGAFNHGVFAVYLADGRRVVVKLAEPLDAHLESTPSRGSESKPEVLGPGARGVNPAAAPAGFRDRQSQERILIQQLLAKAGIGPAVHGILSSSEAQRFADRVALLEERGNPALKTSQPLPAGTVGIVMTEVPEAWNVVRLKGKKESPPWVEDIPLTELQRMLEKLDFAGRVFRATNLVPDDLQIFVGRDTSRPVDRGRFSIHVADVDLFVFASPPAEKPNLALWAELPGGRHWAVTGAMLDLIEAWEAKTGQKVPPEFFSRIVKAKLPDFEAGPLRQRVVAITKQAQELAREVAASGNVDVENGIRFINRAIDIRSAVDRLQQLVPSAELTEHQRRSLKAELSAQIPTIDQALRSAEVALPIGPAFVRLLNAQREFKRIERDAEDNIKMLDDMRGWMLGNKATKEAKSDYETFALKLLHPARKQLQELSDSINETQIEFISLVDGPNRTLRTNHQAYLRAVDLSEALLRDIATLDSHLESKLPRSDADPP
jgi:hypothetical protein